MSKKEIKIHQKTSKGRLYQASRLEGNIKKFGNNPIRKPKQSKNK